MQDRDHGHTIASLVRTGSRVEDNQPRGASGRADAPSFSTARGSSHRRRYSRGCTAWRVPGPCGDDRRGRMLATRFPENGVSTGYARRLRAALVGQASRSTRPGSAGTMRWLVDGVRAPRQWRSSGLRRRWCDALQDAIAGARCSARTCLRSHWCAVERRESPDRYRWRIRRVRDPQRHGHVDQLAPARRRGRHPRLRRGARPSGFGADEDPSQHPRDRLASTLNEPH